MQMVICSKDMDRSDTWYSRSQTGTLLGPYSTLHLPGIACHHPDTQITMDHIYYVAWKQASFWAIVFCSSSENVDTIPEYLQDHVDWPLYCYSLLGLDVSWKSFILVDKTSPFSFYRLPSTMGQKKFPRRRIGLAVGSLQIRLRMRGDWFIPSVLAMP